MADAPAPTFEPTPATPPPITGQGPTRTDLDPKAMYPNDAIHYFDSVADQDTPTPDPHPADKANVVAMAIGNTQKQGADQYTDYAAKHSAAFDHIQDNGDEVFRKAAEDLEYSRALSFYASQGTAAAQAGDVKSGEAFSNLAQAEIKERQALTQKSALEKMAVGQMLQAQKADPFQAWIIQRNLTGSAEQDLVENNATLLAIHRAVQEAGVTADNRNWFEHLTGFLMSVVPYHAALNTVDLSNHVKAGTAHWWDALQTGSTVSATTSNIWNMPYKQRIEFINTKLIPLAYEHSGFMGLHDKGETLDGLSELSANGNAWHYWDQAGMNALNLALTPGIGKFATLPVRIAVRLGGTRMAVDTASAIAALVKNGGEDTAVKTLGAGADAVVDAVTPTMLNPAKAGIPISESATGNILAHAAAQAVDVGGGLTDQVVKQPTDRVLSEAERSDMVNSWKNVMKGTAMGDHIQDVQVTTKQVGVSRVAEAQTVLGQPNSAEGWIDEASAKNAASELHLEAEPFEAENGQWYLKHTQIVPEDLGGKLAQIQPNATNWFTRMLGGTRVISDLGIADQGAQGQDVMGRLQQFFQKRYQGVFSSLDGPSAKRLNGALQGMMNQKFWMSDRGLDEFYQRAFNRPVSSKELDAYHAYVEHNDVKYYLENSLQFKRKALQGMEGLTLHTGAGTDLEHVNAKIDRSLSLDLADLNSEPVWDTQTGSLKTGSYSEGDLAAMKEKGIALATLEERSTIPGSPNSFRRVLVKAGDPDGFIHSLNPIQVPYIGGGNRMYADGLYYLKQAAKDTWGTLINPNVLSAGTKAQVDYMAKQMNGALDIWRGAQDTLKENIKQAEADYLGKTKGAVRNSKRTKWMTSPERNQIIDEATIDRKTALDLHFGGDPRWDGDSFEDMMKSEQVHPDFEFGTYYDKEMPQEYRAADAKTWAAQDENGADQMRRSTGRLFFGKKGEQLLDWQGKLVPTLDPLKMVDRTTRAVSHMVAMDDFKQSAIARWFSTFKDSMDFDPKMSQYQIFNRATPQQNIPMALAQKMEAQRDVIKRMLGYQSPDMEAANSLQRSLRDWMQGGIRVDENGVPQPSFRQNFDWNVEKNPVEALKNFAFDTRIGLWDISRFPLHASISTSAMALDPLHGPQGFMLWPMIRHFLTVAPEGEESTLNTLIGRGVHQMGGMKADEFKQYMMYIKNNGFLHVGGSSELKSSNVGSLLDHYSKLHRSTTFFFDEAEFLNRSVASRIAWHEAIQKFKPNTPEFDQFFAGRTRDYSFNMDRASTAAWQKGLLGIPTQFYAYPMRQFEALVGNRFTNAQKMRLVLAHSILFGSAGTFPAAIASQVYSAATGLKPGATVDNSVNALDTPLGAMDRGLVDEIFWHVAGADVSAGSRYGTGNVLPELYRDIFGMSAYGEKSLADIGGGTSFGQSGAMLGTIYDVIKYAVAESGDRSMPLTEFAVTRVLENAALFSHAMKAYMIYKYGQLQSNNGGIVEDNIPKVNAFAMGFMGLQPGTAAQVTGMKEYLDNKDKQIKELRNHFLTAREAMATRPDDYDDIVAQVNTLSRLNHPDVVSAASAQATRMMPDTIAHALQKRYERAKTLESAEDNTDDNEGQQ